MNEDSKQITGKNIEQANNKEKVNEQADGNKKSTFSAAFNLFFISFLALFFEMLCIRWIPAQDSFLGLFTNFVLLACFLGLGLGLLLTWLNRRMLNYFPVMFFLLILIVLFFQRVQVITHDTEVLFLQYHWSGVRIHLYFALALFFSIIAAVFIPLGQEMGRLFGKLPAIPAYSANILGSILGVAVFSLFSIFSVPSFMWIACGLLLIAWFFRQNKTVLVIHILLSIIMVFMIYSVDKNSTWSPYHRISKSRLQLNLKTGSPYPFDAPKDIKEILFLPFSYGFNIFVNGIFYQQPMNLSNETVKSYYWLLRRIQIQYEAPYKVGNNDEILIVGGGSGNDTAAALRNGAKKVDVVDIDPAILKIGKQAHPEKPYTDPRVATYVDDARSYFKKNAGRKLYDKIVFGLLDSHIHFSGMSTIRIDSYVYTVESIREASKLLKPNGLLVISHALNIPPINDKLYLMMKIGTGIEPFILSKVNYQPIGVTIVGGSGIHAALGKYQAYPIPNNTYAVTDDWPFFYLTKRKIGSDYLVSLSIILLISILAVFLSGRKMHRGVNAHFFLLGAAFMLLESKSMTTLAVLFGSTWMVNSIVIGSVLVMVLLANLFVLKTKVNRLGPYYLLLFLSVIIAYFVPLQILEGLNVWHKIVIATSLTFLPIFFAGIIFATSFSKTMSTSYALGSNIIGGIIGGVMEYQSMVTGFRYLLIMVFLLYLLSYFALVMPVFKKTQA